MKNIEQLKCRKKKYVNPDTYEIKMLPIEDELVLNGTFQPILKYYVYVKDKKGNSFGVLKNNKKLLSGEYISLSQKYLINCKKHGPQKIIYHKRLKESLIPEKYKVYCSKCKEEYLNPNYVPTKEDIQEFKNFLNEYTFINSRQTTEKYFRNYLSRFLNIVKNINLENTKLSFSRKIYVFKENIKELPICKFDGCNNKVEPLKSTYGFKMYCKKHENYNFSSKAEDELLNFINKELNIPIVLKNKRDIIKRELDLYIPEKNTAIEFNGIYWHSDYRIKDKYYHFKKWKACRDKNINLITIWEDDWKNKQDIIKCFLKTKLHSLENKMYADKLSIKEVNKAESKRFLNNNHTQGYKDSTINIGLYNVNELVSLITFKKDKEYELLRYCNKLNLDVINGCNKLFDYFIKIYNVNKIISLASLDYLDFNLYEQLKFKEIKCIDVSYWWTKTIRYDKNKFKDLNEKEIKKQKYRKIWDVGHLMYEWTSK